MKTFLAAALLCLSFALPVTARADEDAFSGLTTTQFNVIATSVSQIAQEGGPRALPVLRALSDHKLFAAKEGDGLFIQTDSGWQDARTGAAATPDPEMVRPVRLNNHVRQAVAAAEAQLQLIAGTPAERQAAATLLYQRHDPAMLPAIDAALGKTDDASLKTMLQDARAATLLTPGAPPSDEQTQRQAVATLYAAGGLDARGVLTQATTSEALAPATRKDAQDAVASIDRSLRLWGFGQDAFYGLSLGSVLLLAAMGLAITFGVMGVINMAHGELMMIGAYTTWLTQRAVMSVAPSLGSFSLILAVPAAFLVCGALGILIERGLIRFLYGRPLETLLATWGLSLILQQVIRSLFGPTNVAVITPSWLSGSFHLGGLEITLNRLAIMIFAIAVMGGLMLVLRRTSLGLEMRAVTQNRRMAALMGIHTARVDALTFGLGSGIAGLAGVAVSQIDNVSPNLGQNYIIDSFLVVVFGGVGNLWGTLAAAMTLGVGGKALEPIVGAVSGKILILVLVILYIQRHPRGMFPLRGRGVES
ncbi:urea ABC transporter permease subunit UrtB [Acetobacter conturbans]|nr:urea ABC transporter permease subunit UrtB [Acetobacter conturbans]